MPNGGRVLIRSGDATARSALLRATAGFWEAGEGRIVRPALARIAFLPERPYIPPGTLRDALGGRGGGPGGSDADAPRAPAARGLEELVTRAGGLDEQHEWNDLLSLGEQQLVSIARLLLSRPRFVFADQLARTVDAAQRTAAHAAFDSTGITSITIGD